MVYACSHSYGHWRRSKADCPSFRIYIDQICQNIEILEGFSFMSTLLFDNASALFWTILFLTALGFFSPRNSCKLFFQSNFKTLCYQNATEKYGDYLRCHYECPSWNCTGRLKMSHFCFSQSLIKVPMERPQSPIFLLPLCCLLDRSEEKLQWIRHPWKEQDQTYS